MKPRDPRGDGGGTSTRITSQLRLINIHRREITVGADKNGTPVFVHFSAQDASISNISEAIMLRRS